MVTWFILKWKQLWCDHDFEPWYHALHCCKCGKTYYD